MLSAFTKKLQLVYSHFTVVLQFFRTPFHFVDKVVVENSYSFYNKFSPPRARKIFFILFFPDFSIQKECKTVRKLKKSVPQGFIWFFKNCKVTVNLCKVSVNKTVKEGVGV